MKIGSSKKLVASAFIVGVMGLAALPLGASAQSYHNYNWNNNWNYRQDNDRFMTWRAHNVAMYHHPGRNIVRENRFRNRDNDVIIIVIFVDGCHGVVRERDGAFLGQYYS